MVSDVPIFLKQVVNTNKCLIQPEKVGSMFTIIKSERSGLVNRNCAGFAVRVDLLSCMKLQRVKMVSTHNTRFNI